MHSLSSATRRRKAANARGVIIAVAGRRIGVRLVLTAATNLRCYPVAPATSPARSLRPA
jgi:hypothetical protein